jgi:hypothetical protein
MDDASLTNIRTLKHLAEDLILRNRTVLRGLCEHLEEWSPVQPSEAKVD